MKFTREIYWNVGADVLAPMYFIALLSTLALLYGFYSRSRVYRHGKPLHRLDDIATRVAGGLVKTFGQVKVIGGGFPGLGHGIFFWSFILLACGTTLVFIQADITDPLFGYRFLKGGFYKLFSLTLDIAGLAAIIMMLGLFVRRYVVRPEGLESAIDDLFIYALLFAVLVTGFIVEGLRMAATEIGQNMELAYYSPVGLATGLMFTGLERETMESIHKSMWWIHFAFSTLFIASIPYTKLRHIFTTPLNYVLEDRRPKGSLDTLDLEDEDTETFGAAKAGDLSWKDIFDTDACTRCKRCQDVCPAYSTGKPLSPMKLIERIGDTAFGDIEGSMTTSVGKEAIWACTMCRACQDTCPASVEHVTKVLEMRRGMALMEGEFPGDEVVAAMDNIEVNANPFGLAPAARGDWANGLDSVDYLKNIGKADIVYFAGCYASYDQRNKKVAISLMKILKSAGISVGILGAQEKCCGDPARRIGNEYLYQQMARGNIDTIKSYDPHTVVTSCPHCYNTLEKDYRDLGFDLKVEHYTVFLDRLVKEGKLEIASREFDLTYHDSCFLGRYNGIYNQPRDLIKAAGGRIVEMSRARENSFCCGAGGGRVLAEEKLGSRINAARATMAVETGAGSLVSNCPFCLTMFEDGVKTAELEEKITPKDITEIISDRL